MAAKIERLAQEFQEKYPELANLLTADAQVARKLGVPEEFADVASASASVVPSVEVPTVKTPETKLEIKRFSKEALDFLKKKGLLHYSLSGQSLQEQRLGGRPFLYIVDAGETFLHLPSMRSEVAFHPSPDKFFLPKSNNLTLPQQQEMVDEYSFKLQREFGGDEIGAIIGDAPDYTSLAFAHSDATKREYLFGRKYNCDHTRTKTPTGGSRVARVGSFHAGYGLDVYDWFADRGNDFVRVAPLVVPTGK